MKPKLLDLFCGAGGAARGYQMAGFHVTGIDNRSQPRYVGDVFIQGDALNPPVRLEDFDVIHASPPCQGYSRMRHLPWLKNRVYPLLIEPTREMLVASGVPYVIENVEDAPLTRAPSLFGTYGVVLCGQMFGLEGQFRHRVFESSVPLLQPAHPRHSFVMAPGSASLSQRYPGRVAGVGAWQKAGGVAGHFGNRARAERSMGIDWMTVDELREAIPPAHTEFIGGQLLDQLRGTSDFAPSSEVEKSEAP